MNEFIEQFLIEGRELVAQGSDDLLALEANRGDKARLDGAFRAFHTLKGAAGIVDFAAMARVLHAGEDVLVAIRAGSTTMTASVTNLCLACLDQVSAWLDEMQATGTVPAQPEARADEIVQQFLLVSAGSSAGREDINDDAVAVDIATAGALSPAGRALLDAQVMLLSDIGIDGARGRWGSAGRVAVNVLRHHRLLSQATSLEASVERSLGSGNPGELADAILEIVEGLSPAGSRPATARDTTLRVDVRRIDELVKLVGELTVAKNALGHYAGLAQEEADPRTVVAGFRTQHARIERVVSEIQHAIVGLRVVPLHLAFQRFPRLVRDISGSLGKQARLMVEGAATEADRSVVAAIADPLLHIIRNSLDHGLEAPADRAALGKPIIATIRLRGTRQDEHIVVEVEDDGSGLDLDRIRAVAVARGIVASDAAAAMSDDEATALIFAPGFSTASRVTSLSGRGVGMDVVRTTIERMGGRIGVTSRPGVGTTVRLMLPFNVMMTRVLTVEAANQIFGIPLDAVVETARLPREAAVSVGAGRAIVLRNRTVPVIDLSRSLGYNPVADRAEIDLVIVDTGRSLGALEVEKLGARMDVMLTAPEGLLAGVRGVEGTTLMGDGRVLIVLDLREIL